MAASPATEPTASRDIPTRHVEVHDPEQLPAIGLSTTPGGTLFGTTPGGEHTRNNAVIEVVHFSFCLRYLER